MARNPTGRVEKKSDDESTNAVSAPFLAHQCSVQKTVLKSDYTEKKTLSRQAPSATAVDTMVEAAADTMMGAAADTMVGVAEDTMVGAAADTIMEDILVVELVGETVEEYLAVKSGA